MLIRVYKNLPYGHSEGNLTNGNVKVSGMNQLREQQRKLRKWLESLLESRIVEVVLN